MRPGRTLDVANGKLVMPQPGRESSLIAAQLDPIDADGRAAALDDGAAWMVDVVDVPLDEEGETVGQRGVEGDEVPREFDAVGTGATHRERLRARRDAWASARSLRSRHGI